MLAVICLAAAGSAALVGPWLLPSRAPDGPTPQSQPVQDERAHVPEKGPRAIAVQPIPAVPAPTAAVPAVPASPVVEEETATLAPPRAAPMAETAAEGASPISPDGTVAASPALTVAPEAAPPPDDVRAAVLPAPSVASSAEAPAEASLVTGSLAVPQVPPPSSLDTDAARGSTRTSRALPLPKAFKPSTERAPARALPQRRASLPDPARAEPPRLPAAVSRGLVRSPVSSRPVPAAQPPVTRPSSVVLPNSLLPFGAN